MFIVRTWKEMPRLVRFVLRNIAIGIAVGWLFLAAILWADVGGLFTMISHSGQAFAVMSLLMGGFAVTFGPAAVASAVLMGHEFREDDDLDKASPAPVTELKPRPARVVARR